MGEDKGKLSQENLSASQAGKKEDQSKSKTKVTPQNEAPPKIEKKVDKKAIKQVKQPVKSKQMMFGVDKKLAPSDISDQQQALRPGWVNSL